MDTKDTNPKEISKRVLEVVSDAYHPVTGDVCLTEETIRAALTHKTIGRYAYILHDKDTYNADEAKAYNKRHSSSEGYTEVHEGDLKPAHWHVVLEAAGHNSFKVSTVARWFGVDEQFVAFGKDRAYNEFLDRVTYITHEDSKQQAKGKHRYEDAEVTANFDFRSELSARAERIAKYGRDLTPEKEIGYKVLYEGMTIKQVMRESPLFYEDHYREVEGWRGQYLTNVAQLPPYRINFYISGASHSGKSFLSEGLARLLIDPEHKLDDDEIFFRIGDKGASFEKYDGQPVIIWDDYRSNELVETLGGYQRLYTAFDTHPKNQRVNVKYGSTKLINSITIVNGQESWRDFLKGCHSPKEDPVQANRRFPFFFVLHDDDYDFGVLDAYYSEDGSFFDYELLTRVKASFGQIAELFGNNIERVNILNDKAIKPVLPRIEGAISKLSPDDTDDETFEAYSNNIGNTDESTDSKEYYLG